MCVNSWQEKAPDTVGGTPQEFAAFFKNEVDRYATSANIRAAD